MPYPALFLYLAVINLLGFLFMGLDKRRAVKGKGRISEKGLLLPGLWAVSWGCCWE